VLTALPWTVPSEITYLMVVGALRGVWLKMALSGLRINF